MTPWCKGCGAKIEWHPHVDGRLVAINPDPDPAGNLAFGANMKLEDVLPGSGSSRRLYRYHIRTCSKPERARGTTTREGLKCFKCGKAGHFANVCEEEDDG